MSRNKEKAHSGLNRYYEQKMHDAGVVMADLSNKPKRVQNVKTIAEAELWRKSVMSEFSAKLAAINDPSLDENEICEINDHLNKLHREKRAWEYHILSLGGNDYVRYEKRIGIRRNGKMYFGRAKELREAKEPEIIKLDSQSKSSKQSPLSLKYYGDIASGWIDPIDPSKERVMEEINAALAEKETSVASENSDMFQYTQRDVEKWLVERRKRELMAKLMT